MMIGDAIINTLPYDNPRYLWDSYDSAAMIKVDDFFVADVCLVIDVRFKAGGVYVCVLSPRGILGWTSALYTAVIS